MPRKRGLVLTDADKRFIRTHAHKFTVRELAEHFNVSKSVISSYGYHWKLEYRRSDYNHKTINEGLFNVNQYLGDRLFIQ
jgi:predicted DNA-binding protein YlxM (UPF0122 family)